VHQRPVARHGNCNREHEDHDDGCYLTLYFLFRYLRGPAGIIALAEQIG
jgi:hypothetical protein